MTFADSVRWNLGPEPCRSPRKRVRNAFCGAAALLVLTACATPDEPDLTPDMLADAGWSDLLADNGAAWRTVGETSLRPEWSVQDGILALAGKGGGDITNGVVYEDFELEFDWKVEAGGNSGIFYFVDLDHDETKPWQTGPEYQILDNEGHDNGQDPLTSAGSNFALHATDHSAANPAGQWNQGRIIARDGQVEHWLNGQRVVSYDVTSADTKRRIEASKFKRWQDTFAQKDSGALVLQDHGDPVQYRNIRIRQL